ncbi:reticulon-like protein B12 isoform X2 [Musa acuminata AAA Group]|uniref:reticulon-like protein B12 isoform X2 n=1 Tax=Musa acuminata AAA Group TaxID=214697 RepID=UPI0031CDB337
MDPALLYTVWDNRTFFVLLWESIGTLSVIIRCLMQHPFVGLHLISELCLTVADVILWRRKNVTIAILLGALASWLVFEVVGYTLLSLVSNVLLLLISILFLWAKAAEVLNRPPPPMPEMHLSEEMIYEAAVLFRFHVNKVLSAFNDIVQGKDPKLFYTVALCLWLISMVGGLTDMLTLGYTSIAIILTVPALYEKYEDGLDQCVKLAHMQVKMYEAVYTECLNKYFIKAKKWILEKKKLITDV